MKRGAIFDMDGTLVDTEKFFRDAWIETADAFGVQRKPELAAAMSGSQRAKMPEILYRFHPTVDAEKYIEMVYARVDERRETELELKAGAREILEYFSANKIPMAVASSSKAAVVEKNLTRVDIKKYFTAIIGGDEVQNGKPAPDIFLKAAEMIHVPAEDCYIFEDSFNGLRAAAAAKGAAIFVIDCVQPTEEIRALSSGGVYENLKVALTAIRQGDI